MNKIILVSSDSHLRTRINSMLSSPCKTVPGYGELLQRQFKEPVLFIIDEKLMDGTLQQAMWHVSMNFPTTPVISLFKTNLQDSCCRYRRFGTLNFLPKSFSDEAFKTLLTELKLTCQEPVPSYDTNRLIGSSGKMMALKAQINELSDCSCSVHLQGETGTGKEIIANMLHKKGNLIVENCSVLKGPLSDGVLFGHKKGAYTGADSDRSGLLQEANGGTLFLDEIENMGLTTQSKLLRVIEDGSYRPLGTSQTYHTHFRLITAGNIRLEQLIKKKMMREDFYFRIADVQLQVPPLRERMEDLEELCNYYLIKNKEKRNISRASLSAMQAYHWPGNVRQLFSVIHRACITCKNLESIDIPASSFSV